MNAVRRAAPMRGFIRLTSTPGRQPHRHVGVTRTTADRAYGRAHVQLRAAYQQPPAGVAVAPDYDDHEEEEQ